MSATWETGTRSSTVANVVEATASRGGLDAEQQNSLQTHVLMGMVLDHNSSVQLYELGFLGPL
jgi:hypothetical protein